MTIKCKAIFISDIHLGSVGCRDDLVLKFLKEYDAEKIYLIGDIIDFWRINQNPYWPQSHNDVLQKLLRKGRKGSEIIYIPGNHDESMRVLCNKKFGSVTIKYDDFYKSIEGKIYYITHGDQFDYMMKKRRLSIFGCRVYNILLKLNNTLFKSIKKNTNRAKTYEKNVIENVKKMNVDGVICGHIHSPKIKNIDNFIYCNCGDFTENFTALIENLDGKMEIVYMK